MPENQPHRTKPRDRVRIKDSVTHMYPNARVYNEATVRRRMHDSLGYPLIYVEWDKDHWAYSGEEDRWVLEAHFDKVEEHKMAAEEKPDFMQALSDLLKQYQDQDAEPEEKTDDEKVSAIEPGTDYDSVLDKAVEDARNGEAFIIIVATPEEYRGTALIAPHAYVHSKRDDAGFLVEAVMADLVAQNYSRLASDFLQVKREDGGGT